MTGREIGRPNFAPVKFFKDLMRKLIVFELPLMGDSVLPLIRDVLANR